MFEIERSLGIAGSWFFRLSTVDPSLMASIAEAGAEASYHYEELATIAKHRRLRTREAGLAALPEARDRFAANLDRLRELTGLPMRVVASHGDFMNRRLGLPNWEILTDVSVPGHGRCRPRGLRWSPDESRHRPTLRHAPSRVLDPGAIRRPRSNGAMPVVHVLVHPRHWRTARRINAADDLRRVAETVQVGLPIRPRDGRTTTVTLSSLRARLDRALVIIRAPRVRIAMFGGPRRRTHLSRVHGPPPAPAHHRGPSSGASRWCRLRGTFDEYLARRIKRDPAQATQGREAGISLCTGAVG